MHFQIARQPNRIEIRPHNWDQQFFAVALDYILKAIFSSTGLSIKDVGKVQGGGGRVQTLAKIAGK